ncbi:MAG: citrate/2-methylcitrate synthase [Bacillota bacterium]
MLPKIEQALTKLDDQALEEEYLQLITTLLEKGYFPGLEGVPVAKSSISCIDGKKGLLTFRGYPVQELAKHGTYEEISFLLLKGDLPLLEERKDLTADLLANKELDPGIANTITTMSDDLHPMHMLSSSVSLLQSADQDCFEVDNYNKNLNRAVRLIAKLPTIIGTFKNKDINFADGENFDSLARYILYCFNEELAQQDKWINIFEQLLILHVDHTMNNSTFSVRAVGSSKASLYASIATAVNSLSGPLHGGANERVIKMLKEIGAPDNVESYVADKIKNKEKIMGIGHRVYKTYDPRALYLKENILPQIFNEENDIDSELENLYNTAQKLEQIALNKFANKGIYPNVDFWSGLVLRAMDIKPEYFTTVFALGRIIGWTSHWVENMEVKNKIYRPKQLYDGFNTRHIVRKEE